MSRLIIFGLQSAVWVIMWIVCYAIWGIETRIGGLMVGAGGALLTHWLWGAKGK